jgi:hypothetical protein
MARIGKRLIMLAGGAVAATSITMFTLLSADDLQTRINNAPCGSVIELEAGATVTANLKLPNKSCTDYITIQSSRASELPVGQRVNPATQAHLLAKIQGGVAAEPVIQTALAAHHYKFIGVEISTVSADTPIYDLVRFGDGRETQRTLADVAHHLVIDRSWVHGWSTQDLQGGVTMNCADCWLINSFVTDIHWEGIEAQAVRGWNGTNGAHIVNNRLEGAAQNILIGGADSATAELMPRDIEIRGNHLFKPLSWKVGHATYAGHHWTVKNLLELKSAVNVIIDGNVMEHNWTDGQDGKAILFTVRNQECSAPWSTIQNVTFTNNSVIDAEGGLNLLGRDNEATVEYVTAHPDKCNLNTAKLGSVRGSNLTISNNLFHDINGNFLTMSGFDNVDINHNTHVQQGNLMTLYGEVSSGFRYTDNLTIDHDFGIVGDGVGGGMTGLNKLTPSWVVSGNLIAAPYDNGTNYPPDNLYPKAITITPDWRSPVAGVGAGIDQLLAAQAGVVVAQPSPSPSPSATATVTVSPSPTATATPIATPTATPLATSPDNTRVPPATQLVDSTFGIWTLVNGIMSRNSIDSGGRGSLILWFSGQVYAIGTDGNWWRYVSGVEWTRVAGDPAVQVTPTPTPTPTVSPTPSPSPSPVTFCRSGTRPAGGCVCRNGFLGNSGKCR